VGTDGEENTISIENNSENKANVGIGMDEGLAVVLPNVSGGVNAVFEITPTYYVAAYQNLQIGQEISTVELIGDPIVFDSNYKKATVTLVQIGNTLKLELKYNVI